MNKSFNNSKQVSKEQQKNNRSLSQRQTPNITEKTIEKKIVFPPTMDFLSPNEFQRNMNEDVLFDNFDKIFKMHFENKQIQKMQFMKKDLSFQFEEVKTTQQKFIDNKRDLCLQNFFPDPQSAKNHQNNIFDAHNKSFATCKNIDANNQKSEELIKLLRPGKVAAIRLQTNEVFKPQKDQENQYINLVNDKNMKLKLFFEKGYQIKPKVQDIKDKADPSYDQKLSSKRHLRIFSESSLINKNNNKIEMSREPLKDITFITNKNEKSQKTLQIAMQKNESQTDLHKKLDQKNQYQCVKNCSQYVDEIPCINCRLQQLISKQKTFKDQTKQNSFEQKSQICAQNYSKMCVNVISSKLKINDSRIIENDQKNYMTKNIKNQAIIFKLDKSSLLQKKIVEKSYISDEIDQKNHYFNKESFCKQQIHTRQNSYSSLINNNNTSRSQLEHIKSFYLNKK